MWRVAGAEGHSTGDGIVIAMVPSQQTCKCKINLNLNLNLNVSVSINTTQNLIILLNSSRFCGVSAPISGYRLFLFVVFHLQLPCLLLISPTCGQW